MQKLPLDGIRILDFCQMWAGGHLSEWLAVMGAEVIKVETNLRMDFMRAVGAPAGLAGTGPDVGSCFATLGFGKKSIIVNMNTPKAQELIKRFIKTCDVVTENYGGAILERWGLSYAAMKSIKPDIIYYAGSGYGREGLYKERPAYAEIVDAFSGATAANGYPGSEPMVIGVSPWTDGGQAMHGAFAVMAAIYHHKETGEGQYIDGVMIESSSNFLGEMVMGYTINGTIGERLGNRDLIMAPHNAYPCKNTNDEPEWIAIAVENKKEWKSLCKLMGNPAWTKKPEFSDEISRWKNQDELDKNLKEWTKQFGSYELAEKLQKAGITAAASLSTKQLTHDKHMAARKFFIEVDHPVLGKITLTSLPIRYNGKPTGNYQCAPLLGQHNKYVFGELLGLTDKELEQYYQDKIFV